MSHPNSARDPPQLGAPREKALSPEERLREDWNNLHQIWQEIIKLWPEISRDGASHWDDMLLPISKNVVSFLGQAKSSQDVHDALDKVHDDLELGRILLVEAGQQTQETQSLAFVDLVLEGEQHLGDSLIAWPAELASDEGELPDIQTLQKDQNDLQGLLLDIIDGLNKDQKRDPYRWQSEIVLSSQHIARVLVTKRGHFLFDPKVKIGELWLDLEVARGHLVKGSYYTAPEQRIACKKEIAACQRRMRAALDKYRFYSRK